MDIPFHTPLAPDQQRSFGLTEPAPLAMADQVRFSHLDVLNHVNNVAYFEWFERLRIRYHQDWGMSSYDHAPDSPRIVVRSGEIRYHRETHLDEVYIATCGCIAFRDTSYTLRQQVWSGGSLRVQFDCVMVLLRQGGSGRFPIPASVKERFRTIDKAAPS